MLSEFSFFFVCLNRAICLTLDGYPMKDPDPDILLNNRIYIKISNIRIPHILFIYQIFTNIIDLSLQYI